MPDAAFDLANVDGATLLAQMDAAASQAGTDRGDPSAEYRFDVQATDDGTLEGKLSPTGDTPGDDVSVTIAR